MQLTVFGKKVDPAVYRRGFGFWGYVIFLAGRLVVWLEHFITRKVVEVEGVKRGMPREDVKWLVRQAMNNPELSGVVERPDSVPRIVRGLLDRHGANDPASLDERTYVRYRGERVGEELDGDGTLGGTLAKYQTKDRSASYLAGRSFFYEYSQEDEDGP